MDLKLLKWVMTQVYAHNIGFVNLICSDTNINMKLNDLLHVSTITKNIMSVSKFAHDNNVYFVFYHNTCGIKL